MAGLGITGAQKRHIFATQASGDNKMEIFDRISSQLVDWRERITRLKENHGSFKVSEITVEQLYGGIRGVPTSVSDISYVDAHEGIRLRGYTIPEIINLLPRMDGA